MTTDEIKVVLGTLLKVQSLIHSIDEMSDTVVLKRELKRSTNRYLQELEKYAIPLTKQMDIMESQYFVDIVAQLDKICDEINVEISPDLE